MANTKMTDFRKRTGQKDFSKKDAKEAAANYELLSQRIETLTTLVFGLSKRIFEMDGKLRSVTRDANAAQWRSQAILEVLNETVDANGVVLVTKKAVAAKAEQLQIEDFSKDAAEFDRVNDLTAVEGPAELGHFATVSIDYFKAGVKLEEQKTVRSKIHLGKHELFPELDDQIKGMIVGEVKRFPLSLMGLTDEAELQLIDLKKPQPKEEPKHEPVKTEG